MSRYPCPCRSGSTGALERTSSNFVAGFDLTKDPAGYCCNARQRRVLHRQEAKTFPQCSKFPTHLHCTVHGYCILLEPYFEHLMSELGNSCLRLFAIVLQFRKLCNAIQYARTVLRLRRLECCGVHASSFEAVKPCLSLMPISLQHDDAAPHCSGRTNKSREWSIRSSRQYLRTMSTYLLQGEKMDGGWLMQFRWLGIWASKRTGRSCLGSST